MTANDALEFIHGLRWMSRKLGLSKTQDLLSRLGNPEKDLKFIHIGGTNGKGSTSAMLAEILRASGYKTGLFTSPFIMRFNERIMVSTHNEGDYGTLPGFMEIPDADLASITEEIKAVIEGMDEPPSEFEVVTVIGFLYFKRTKCDIVVLEVGMGGEFDATNVIPSALVTILTNIGLDHMEYLGNTIGEIAKTKAGIIKSGTSAVFYGDSPEALSEIQKRCDEVGATLVTPDFMQIKVRKADLTGQKFDYKEFRDIELSLIGNYMQKNAAVVFEAVKLLRDKKISISEEAIKQGLQETKWIARLECLSENPTVLVDGSHNPQGMRATIDTVKNCVDVKKDGAPRFICVFGVMADKDVSGILTILQEAASEIICVQPVYPRAMKHDALYALAVSLCESESTKVIDGGMVEDGIRLGLSRIREGDILLCLGSLYMAGEVRNYFRD